MNLRFVFSLIVSLLSLLPAAAQDLTRNWIRERIFLDAEGKECVTSVQYFDGIGREKAKAYYNHDHTHTSFKGAQLNAKSVAKGLKDIHSSLAEYLK